MAHNTFQGRLRTLCGRSKDTMDIRTGLPATVLPQNLMGPIQLVVTNLGANVKEIGYLPAYFCIEKIAVITPAGGGTVAVDLPAYTKPGASPATGGLAAVSLVAAAPANAKGDLTMVAGQYNPWGLDRPITLTGVAATTGLLRIGIFGFPLDNASKGSI